MTLVIIIAKITGSLRVSHLAVLLVNVTVLTNYCLSTTWLTLWLASRNFERLTAKLSRKATLVVIPEATLVVILVVILIAFHKVVVGDLSALSTLSL